MRSVSTLKTCLQMLVEWLKEGMQEGRPAGRYLVLLYLVRGRLPEALKAFQELRSSLPEAKTGDLVLLMIAQFPSGNASWLCNASACL